MGISSLCPRICSHYKHQAATRMMTDDVNSGMASHCQVQETITFVNDWESPTTSTTCTSVGFSYGRIRVRCTNRPVVVCAPAPAHVTDTDGVTDRCGNYMQVMYGGGGTALLSKQRCGLSLSHRLVSPLDFWESCLCHVQDIRESLVYQIGCTR